MKYEDALPIEEWVRAARVHARSASGGSRLRCTLRRCT
jgi:hypothetical protein